MEISTMDLERALRGVNELALPVLAASCLYPMVCHFVRNVVSGRVEPAPRTATCSAFVRRGVSALGLLVSLGSPAAAGERPLPRRHLSRSVEPLSLRSEPDRFPPPRLSGPAEPPPARSGVEVEPPWTRSNATSTERVATRPVHRAVHSSGDSPGGRLFERATARPPKDEARVARIPAPRPAWHAVLPGETLWSIAADRLRTDDVRRIARYWPRIHRANRDEIGSNPSLIFPGQVLELPPESA
jgi:hypothetical protein